MHIVRAVLCACMLAICATPASAQTVRTGDVIDGTPVIDALDVSDLSSGRTHRFWFRVTDNSVGQGWYVPVIVVRGARKGPRLMLTAAVHGDELNGIDVVHQLTAKIDPAHLNGTIVGIAGLNTPGILHHTRGFTPSDSGYGANLNRLMPGKATGDIADIYAYRLWTKLLRPNADTVIDLHTQSKGTAYVMYAFAGSKRARQIAELIAPEIIKLDPGVKGTIETEMLNVGIPAITLELARPEEFEPVIVARTVAGIERVMADMKMIASAALATSPPPYLANAITEVMAGRGGFARLDVALGSDVTKGQVVATISDPFGRVTETVKAPETGRVNTVATTPLRDAGDMLMRIVYQSKDRKCGEGC